MDKINYGIVKSFLKQKGFGFISKNNKLDYFFHISSLKSNIEVNDIVSFIIAESKKKKGKYEAINVKKIDDNSIYEVFRNIDKSIQISILNNLNSSQKEDFAAKELNIIGAINTNEAFNKAKLLFSSFKVKKGWNNEQFDIPIQLKNKLFDYCSDEYQIEFWLLGISPDNWNMPIDYLSFEFANYQSLKQDAITKMLHDNQKELLFEKHLANCQKIDSSEKYQKTLSFLTLYKTKQSWSSDKYQVPENMKEELFKITSEGFLIDLWLIDLFAKDWEIPILYISENFHSYKPDIIDKIFRKINDSQKTDLVISLIKRIGIINSNETFNKSIEILEHYRDKYGYRTRYDLPSAIKTVIHNSSTIEYKVEFWLLGINTDSFIEDVCNMFDELEIQLRKKLFDNFSEDESYKYFLSQIKQNPNIANETDFDFYVQILKNIKPSVIISSYIKKNSSPYYQYKLWLSDLFLLDSPIEIKDFISFIDEKSDDYISILCFKIKGFTHSFFRHNYVKNEHNYSMYGKGKLIDKKIKYSELISKMMTSSQHIVRPFWAGIMENMKAEVLELVSERNFKYEILYSFMNEHIQFFTPIDNSLNYTLCIDFLKSFDESVNSTLNRFSKQTIKVRKEIIKLNVYKRIVTKIVSSSSEDYVFQLTLDGYNDKLNSNYVINNIESFDEGIIKRIFSLRNTDVTSQILKYKLNQITEIASDIEYDKTVKLIDDYIAYNINEYDYCINIIKQKSNDYFKVQLWLDRYVKSLEPEILQNFYNLASDDKRKEIINNCCINTQEEIFISQLNNNTPVENPDEYNNLKSILAFFRDNASYVYENVDWLKIISIDSSLHINFWKDGFKSTLTINDIINENTSKSDIVFERIMNLGSISSENSFSEAKDLITYLKNNCTEEEYKEKSMIMYNDKSDYCKIKLYLYDLINISDNQVKSDFEKIFKGQYFKLRSQEKNLFLRKAKIQLPDYKNTILRNIGICKMIRDNNDGTFLYHVNYCDIYFNNNYFLIKIDDNTNLFSKPREWYFSRYSFNILHSYFLEKQQKNFIRITLNLQNEIISSSDLIEDLEELEKNILVVLMQKRSIHDEVNQVAKEVKEIEYKTLSNKDIKRITGEENSECVHYLFDNLLDNFKPIYVNEISTVDNLSASINNGSWLFSIPISNTEIAIIWESTKLDRATHVFKADKNEFEIIIEKIQNYLFSPSMNKRKRLNSNDDEDRKLQSSLNYWFRIEHDWINQCESWYDKIKLILPT